jgi:hypothetical protein
MKRLMCAALLVLASVSYAQEIKGIRIGMTQEAYEKAMEAAGFFTIGGVSPMYAVTRSFDEQGRLQEFSFIFRSSDWEQVRDAVKEKYPKLKCVRSTASNRMGATFPQEHCFFGTLGMSRLVSDIDTSFLSLTSKELADRRRKESNEKKKDI